MSSPLLPSHLLGVVPQALHMVVELQLFDGRGSMFSTVLLDFLPWENPVPAPCRIINLPPIWTYGMGSLWGHMGHTYGVGYGEHMGLRCGTYGVHRGLWECGVGLMGKSMGMAMGLDLWGSMGLRCGTYGIYWDL